LHQNRPRAAAWTHARVAPGSCAPLAADAPAGRLEMRPEPCGHGSKRLTRFPPRTYDPWLLPDSHMRAHRKAAMPEFQFRGPMLLLSGTANRPLAEEIGEHMGMPLGDITVKSFADGEIFVRINQNARGRDVYIIQPT